MQKWSFFVAGVVLSAAGIYWDVSPADVPRYITSGIGMLTGLSGVGLFLYLLLALIFAVGVHYNVYATECKRYQFVMRKYLPTTAPALFFVGVALPQMAVGSWHIASFYAAVSIYLYGLFEIGRAIANALYKP